MDTFPLFNIVLLAVAAYLTYFAINTIRHYLAASKAGIRLGIGQIVAMQRRRVPVSLIVENVRRARQAGVELDPQVLEGQHLLGGDVSRLTDAAILAHERGLDIQIGQLLAADLAGKDPVQYVQKSKRTGKRA